MSLADLDRAIRAMQRADNALRLSVDWCRKLAVDRGRDDYIGDGAGRQADENEEVVPVIREALATLRSMRERAVEGYAMLREEDGEPFAWMAAVLRGDGVVPALLIRGADEA